MTVLSCSHLHKTFQFHSPGVDANGVRSTGGNTLAVDFARRPVSSISSQPGFSVERDRFPHNSTMMSSTMGSRKTVRFADDNPFNRGSSSSPRPVSGDFLTTPASLSTARSGSPAQLTPSRGYMPAQQMTSFIALGESTGSPV
jgi:hypothetical protein